MKRSSVSAVSSQRISPCHIDILLAESARSAGHAPPRVGSPPAHLTIDYRTPRNSRGHSGKHFETGEILTPEPAQPIESLTWPPQQKPTRTWKRATTPGGHQTAIRKVVRHGNHRRFC